jgi:hypothetical protein
VTEVKHFDGVFIISNSVVNNYGTMLQFSDAGTFSDCATHAREPAKQIHVIEQSAAKTLGGLVIVLGNMADDFSEVA